MTTTPLCTFGEDEAPGAGCIKPAGHDGAHLVTPGEPEDDYCPAEYPDPDGLGFVGHLCDRWARHPGDHAAVVKTGGQEHTLRWTTPAA
jgi:hypothetical protein